MRVELDWDDRQILLDLLTEEKSAVLAGEMQYDDNASVVEHIDSLIGRLEDE